MQITTITCPACGGSYEGPVTNQAITCEYCGTRFVLSSEELAAWGFVATPSDAASAANEAPCANVEPLSAAALSAFADQACRSFLKRAKAFEDSFKSSSKILNGLDIPAGEEVYLIHDDTMFKSGKNGFALTSAGVYCRELGEKSSHFVSWEEFIQGDEPEGSECYMYQDGVSLSYFTDNDAGKEQIEQLLKKLWRHARGIA